MKGERFFYWGVISALIIIVLGLYQCKNTGKPCPEFQQKSDTSHVKSKDTSEWHVPTMASVDTFSFLEGGRIPIGNLNQISSRPVPLVKILHDTVWYYEPIPSDILENYYTVRFYRDTTKTKWGNIISEDTVMQNAITAHRLITDFDIPIVTNTTTKEHPKKVKAYWTLSAVGRKQDPFQAAGAGIMLQFKNDQAIELGTLRHFTLNQWQFGVSYKHKITFK